MRIFYFNITYACNSRCIFCAADHPLQLNDTRQMSLEEFQKVLTLNNVGTGDRVIINGGEPTVHPDFFAFLEAVQRTGAKIDLFTNGKRLQELSFTKHLMEQTNIHIRVPLFGASAEVHDQLTGQGGNFAAVTRGLDNALQNLHSGITLEIKMLLSKTTVMENEKIYDLILKRWNSPLVRISLNPLLISGMVIQNKELFLDSYEKLLRGSKRLIENAQKGEMLFSTALIPFCAYPDDFHSQIPARIRKVTQRVYSDPSETTEEDGTKGRNPCRSCVYFGSCSGYPVSYVKYFGTGVMKPFLKNCSSENRGDTV